MKMIPIVVPTLVLSGFYIMLLAIGLWCDRLLTCGRVIAALVFTYMDLLAIFALFGYITDDLYFVMQGSIVPWLISGIILVGKAAFYSFDIVRDIKDPPMPIAEAEWAFRVLFVECAVALILWVTVLVLEVCR